MDIKDLKTLIKMVTETDITEFEMRNDVEKIVIKRGPSHEIVHVAAPSYAPQPLMQAPVAAAPASASPAAASPAAPVAKENQEIIHSPIVGTFYRRPSPDANNFVEVGSVADKGQTVCLVEAMKLFNEIEAEFKCKIVEILKADASPVEFGEPLFLVERL